MGGIIYDIFGTYRLMLLSAFVAHILAATLLFTIRPPVLGQAVSSLTEFDTGIPS
jgi:hypothetical protein